MYEIYETVGFKFLALCANIHYAGSSVKKRKVVFSYTHWLFFHLSLLSRVVSNEFRVETHLGGKITRFFRPTFSTSWLTVPKIRALIWLICACVSACTGRGARSKRFLGHRSAFSDSSVGLAK